MASLTDLPVEILEHIFAHLDPVSIASCQRVSKAFLCFLDSDRIWRDVCRNQGYLDQQQDLQDLKSGCLYSDAHQSLPRYRYTASEVLGRKRKEFEDYKTYLSSSHLLDRAKTDADLSRCRGTWLSPIGVPSTDFKIDHLSGTIIARVGNTGSFCFFGLSTKQLLLSTWSASPYGCGPWETSLGFIFASLRMPGSQIATGFRLSMVRLSMQCSHPEGPSRQGCKMTDLGSFKSRHSIDAVRFKFPILASASLSGYVTFYNLRTKKVVQDVRLQPFYETTASIIQLEFDDEFIWFISDFEEEIIPPVVIQAYSRRDGKQVWKMPMDEDICFNETYSVCQNTDRPVANTGRIDCFLKRTTMYTFSHRPESGNRQHDRMSSNDSNDSNVRLSTDCSPVDSTGLRILAGEDYNLDSWLSLRLDTKTKSLCILSQMALRVIPDVKHFRVPDGHDRILTLKSSDEDDLYEGLAVADGRAAYCTKDKLILVDLASLVTIEQLPQDDFSSVSASKSDAKGRAAPALTTSVRYYVPQSLGACQFSSPVHIDLTATHLAIAGHVHHGETDADRFRCQYDSSENSQSEQEDTQRLSLPADPKPMVCIIDFDQMRYDMVRRGKAPQEEPPQGEPPQGESPQGESSKPQLEEVFASR
ncbi:unnamed protein product [Sympodiomycopsis kandeliae]